MNAGVVLIPLALFALTAGAAGAAGAQAPADDSGSDRPNQLALDVSLLGGTLSYARDTSPSDLVGFMVGGGGLWIASEHFGDDHFGAGDLLGLAHGGPFWRREFGEHLELDAGLQVGAVIHGGDEGNAGLALIGGPFVAPMFGLLLRF